MLQDVRSPDDYLQNMKIPKSPRLAIYTDTNADETEILIIIDKKITIELDTLNMLEAMVALLSAYYAFNLAYDKAESNAYKFLMGIKPRKKTMAYRKIQNSSK